MIIYIYIKLKNVNTLKYICNKILNITNKTKKQFYQMLLSNIYILQYDNRSE